MAAGTTRSIIVWEAGDFWVGDRLVKPSLGEIRLGLERVRLEPRSMSVLLALAERPREVMSKKVLIEKVWGEAYVTDEVLTHAIWDLRKTLGDSASNPEFIQTIPKRGYRLIAPVREAEPHEECGPEAKEAAGKGQDRWNGEERRRSSAGGRNRVRVPVLIVVGLGALGAVLWLSQSGARRTARELRAIAEENAASQLLEDADIAVFVSGSPKDPRAVRDFLLGVHYTYRNETGAGNAMLRASVHDPDFVAPWIFRAGTVLEEGGPDGIRAYLDNLARLHASATVFEKAMIDWARAVVTGRPAEEVRALRVALKEAPAHRIARINLGGALLRMGDPEGCSTELSPLLEGLWHFPGLYTLASLCAIERGALEDLQPTLDAALVNKPVDPEIFDLLRVLAINRADPAAEALYEAALQRRKKEMAPEPYRTPVGLLVGYLADRAESEGKAGIATRLRESVD